MSAHPCVCVSALRLCSGRELASVVYDVLRIAFRLVTAALSAAAGEVYRILGS